MGSGPNDMRGCHRPTGDHAMSPQGSPLDQNTIRRRGIGLRVLDRDRACPGYTLFTPLTGQGEVYLIDLEGKVVHQWTLPYHPGLHGYLLPNGNVVLLGLEKIPRAFVSHIRGGIPGSEVHGDIYGDVVREITPAGTEA